MSFFDTEKKLSILLVEDNPGDLFLLEETLRLSKAPFNKFTATSTAEAIACLRQNNIDVVILDLSLPDSTGFNSFNNLIPYASEIPIIVLTGLSDTELAMETLASGAQDYLIKGEFTHQLLLKSIQYSIERNRIRINLIESSESYRNLFFNNPFSILILEAHSLKILDSNHMAQQEYGYSESAFEELNLTNLIAPDKAIQLDDFRNDFLISDQTQVAGVWEHIGKDGQPIIVNLNWQKIDYKGIPAILSIHNNITEKVRLEEKLAVEKSIKQREINEAMIAFQEKERNEISYELHDNVNQQLTVSLMYLASTAQKYPETAESIKQTSGFILKAIEEIRKLSQTLVTPLIKHFGLSKAIEGLLDDINAVKSIQFELDAENFFEEDIKYDFKLSLFRIVQEQMNNILKYAQATVVEILLERDDTTINLSISDNGIGFDANQQRKGIGLYSIMQRTELYHGNFSIETELGKGCNIKISFPVAEAVFI